MMETIKRRLAYAPHIADRRLGKAGVVLGVGGIVAAVAGPYSLGMMVHMLYSGVFMLVVGVWIWWADNYQRRVEESEDVADESIGGVSEEWQCPDCDAWNYLCRVDDDNAFCSHCGKKVRKDADVNTRPR